jgi:hypothetical protein
MKFTLKSEHEYGTTVEMTFDTAQLDEIEDMFKQFLKGSGFHFEDEEEEPQRPVKSYSNGVAWYATPTSCSLHPDAPHGYDRDRSVNEHRNVCKCESWNPPMPEKDIQISDTADKAEISSTADKPWVGLTEKEIKKIFEMDWNNPSCPEWVIEFSKKIEAKLKEKNNAV